VPGCKEELSQEKIWDAVNTILKFYRELGGSKIFDNPRFQEGGHEEMIYPRLHRAAINQLEDGSATLARYGIWASTMRGILLQAMEELKANDSDSARERITYVINSLGAFIDIQAALDSYPGNMGFYELSAIIDSYLGRVAEKETN
jgi:hypothetical protein